MSWSASELGVRLVPWSWFAPSSGSILNYCSRMVLFCVSFFLFMSRVCHAFLKVHCSSVITCLEGADLLALSCVIIYCVFVTFPCNVLGQVSYLIVSIPDLSLLLTF